MEFGKRTADALEHGEDGEDALLEAAVALIPHYSVREHEILVPLETPYGTINLLGKLDTFDPSTCAFRETKTGRVPWTQNRANKHMQLHQYATMIWLKYHKIPPTVHLDWAETAHNGGEVTFTGKIKTFPVKLGMADILTYMALVVKVGREIAARYRQELKNMA